MIWPQPPARDLEFAHRLVLDGDAEEIWRCRLYRWPDGSARSVRDVDVYGNQLDAVTSGAEEVILLWLVQQARDFMGSATTEPVGRG